MTASAVEARLTIDLDALAANYRTLAGVAGGAEAAPAVKADAYGLGAGPVARRLWAEGARSFFVARISEGEALREALGERPAAIQVLDGCPPAAGPQLLAAGLVPVLNSLAQVEAWNAFARTAGRRLPASLHLDTGINRLGLRPEEAEALAGSPDRLDRLDLSLVISHLACAAEPAHPMNRAQAEAFARLAALFPGARRSLANSGGAFLGPDYRFDMVRPGISLYGGGPFGLSHPDIRPVARLEAPVLQVRHVAPGETVGYGASFVAARPLRVAVLAAGYADGVLRSESPGGAAWIDGRPCPFIGKVSMDLIAVDATDAGAVQPGAMVELLGPSARVDEAAAAAGTIAYELLVRIGARARRVYVGDEDPAVQARQ
jgi:alanine racemase